MICDVGSMSELVVFSRPPQAIIMIICGQNCLEKRFVGVSLFAARRSFVRVGGPGAVRIAKGSGLRVESGARAKEVAGAPIPREKGRNLLKRLLLQCLLR